MPAKSSKARTSEKKRETKETSISLSINIDGKGEAKIDSGIGFFDHMLTLFSKHGGFDITLSCSGDTEVDFHHSAEDIGICLGKAFREALGDCRGIKRYGSVILPMDEALAFVAVDISGRPYLVYEGGEMAPTVGDYDTELTEEFLRAFAFNAGLTLHTRVLYGNNTHHKIEALFKALGHALAIAVRKDGSVKGVLSTKGVL